jgi:hypothetical protein
LDGAGGFYGLSQAYHFLVIILVTLTTTALADIDTDRSTVVMFPIPVDLIRAFMGNMTGGQEG